MCPPVRASATCLTESYAAPPGEPLELPLAFDACGCCITTECHVELDVRRQQVHLSTTLCPDPCDCDACIMPEVTCHVPGLTEGTWTVFNNGAEAFDLPVFSEITAPPPACATFADFSGCGGEEEVSRNSTFPESLCVSPHPWHERDVLRLNWPCPGCGELAGACVVSLEERFTRDLPPGGELRLTDLWSHNSPCDGDCEPGCHERTQDCFVPRLEPGHLYRVWYMGRVVTEFTAGTGERICVPLDHPVPG